MNRTALAALVLLVVLFVAPTLVAEDPSSVITHNLTVEQKLELLETIEITSQRELKETSDEAKDPVVDAILAELAQLESSSVANE